MKEDTTSPEEKADHAFEIDCAIQEDIHGKNSFATEAAKNDALGRNMLKTDLGDFGHVDYDKSVVQQRMIENTRQDVAATYGHAKSAFRYAREAKTFARAAFVLALASCAIGIAILVVLLRG